MNEHQKLLNQVALDEAFKALTKDIQMSTEVEKTFRLIFSAGWQAHRKVAGVDKVLGGFS